jgi:hypothetical protein
MNAVPEYILNIPSASMGKAELNRAVRKLADQGLEIYYYNTEQIIVGSPKPNYPNASLLCRSDSGKLYLITKLGMQRDNSVSNAGTILLDLGSSFLVLSALDDIALRQTIINPFVLMDQTPLRFPGADVINPPINTSRVDIQSLISHVNADSLFSYIQHLQDYQTRYALADNRWEIATWIMEEYLRLGLSNPYLYNYIRLGIRHFNPIATLTGSVFPNTYILVGGHHDSINSVDPMLYAPGADDNASGAAATIEIARAMIEANFQPRCSIIFTTFSAEELGQFGSETYALQALTDSLDLRLVINLDMIANNTTNSNMLKILQYDGSIAHSRHAADITTQYTGMDTAWSYYNYNGTDSYAFWQQGFNVFTISEYDFSPWWHSSMDTTANIDANYSAQIVKAITAIAAISSIMPLAPRNLTVLDTGLGSSLQASWLASSDPSVEHYKVYYGTSESELTYWQTVTDTQCLITGIPEADTCWVGVSAVNASGLESYLVLSKGIPYAVPQMPTNLQDTPQPGSIALRWTPNEELDLAGYKLYRSLNPEVTGTCIATIPASQSSYTDSNLPGTLAYYCYRISAIDTTGNESPLSEVIPSRPISLDMGILVIDETRNYSGVNPFQPTDEMVDAYYDELLDGFNISGHIDLETNPANLRMADICVYSSILWHGNDSADMSYPSGITDILSQYIQLGGNVLFSIYHPSLAFELNAQYPASFDPTSFIYDTIGITATDYNTAARFKYAIPSMEGFPPLQVDSLKTIAYLNGHIFRVESILPVLPSESVYTYGSDYPDDSSQGLLNGQTVGVLHQYGEGKALTLSFPLYNMQPASAQDMANYVFGSLFSEPSPVQEDVLPIVSGITIMPNYPNPFHSETTFQVRTSNSSSPLHVSIYNLKGQLVKKLTNSLSATQNTLHWDANDNNGKQVSSGLYFIRARQNGQTSTRKILLLKQ